MRKFYQLPLLASLLMGISLFLLPIVTVSKNRIQAGEGVSLFDLTPQLAGVIVIVLICLIAITWLRLPRLVIWQAGFWLVAILLVFQGLSQYLHELASYTTAERLSFASGFWLFLLGSYVYFQLIPWPKISWRIMTIFIFVGGMIVIFLFANFSQLGLYQEYQLKATTYGTAITQHLTLALGATAIVIIFGIGLGLIIYQWPKFEATIMIVINILQVIPTIALLGMLMIPLTFLSQQWPILAQFGIRGVGWFPAFIALVCYGLLPMVINTVSGLRAVANEVLEAAKGLGMSQRQIFQQVTLPLAVPVIIAGVRITVTQAMGNTILAGLIGGGGLGNLIFLGLAQSAPELILLGSLTVVTLTLLVNLVLEWGKIGYDYAQKRYKSI
ncbi:MAG: ABC transporter permease [Culicoidibacterales bacterium]